MAGTLYLVPTPIGNLGDISRRCAETLEAVDFLAAEDTRVTLKLLNHLGLKKPLLSYYRHNTGAGGEAVLERLLSGEDGALVTDAGTPAVSDPGEELVAQCAERDIPVVAIGGISHDNILELKNCGLDGVAVVSALFAQADVKAAAEELLRLSEEIAR